MEDSLKGTLKNFLNKQKIKKTYSDSLKIFSNFIYNFRV